MVAGFLAGWTQKKDYEYAFRMGISAGSASAFSELLATKNEVEHVFNGLDNEEAAAAALETFLKENL